MTTPKKVVLAGIFTSVMVGLMFVLRGSDEGNAAARAPQVAPAPSTQTTEPSSKQPVAGKTDGKAVASMKSERSGESKEGRSSGKRYERSKQKSSERLREESREGSKERSRERERERDDD